jgi:hypothetical protein
MELNMDMTMPKLESNMMALLQHQGRYYFSLFDIEGNIITIPVPILDENKNVIGIEPMTKVECDDSYEIHLNLALPPGFYYAKVFFEESFQNGIIFQRVNIA